ncbi:MAG: hypothetical protein ACJ8AW_20485, partial [Rhodopila sp.]
MASGSPAAFALRTTLDRTPLKTIDASEALARHGLPMLRARRLTEELLGHRVFAELPTVDDAQAFIRDMAGCGIAAVLIKQDAAVDVRAPRERLNLTRGQFAICHGLEVETLRDWKPASASPIPPPAATCASSPTRRKRLNRPTRCRLTDRGVTPPGPDLARPGQALIWMIRLPPWFLPQP